MRNGILAAGNWIIDKVKTIDRWPGEGNLCNIVEETRAPGGGPCNLLFDLAAIDPGLPLYAAGRVGELHQLHLCGNHAVRRVECLRGKPLFQFVRLPDRNDEKTH